MTKKKVLKATGLVAVWSVLPLLLTYAMLDMEGGPYLILVVSMIASFALYMFCGAYAVLDIKHLWYLPLLPTVLAALMEWTAYAGFLTGLIDLKVAWLLTLMSYVVMMLAKWIREIKKRR